MMIFMLLEKPDLAAMGVGVLRTFTRALIVADLLMSSPRSCR
jgi:hypothetical protein